MYTPIIVPSKARLQAPLIKIASEQGVGLIIVVEPQDFERYSFTWGKEHKILMIPENNMGLPYVRNFITKYTENIPFYWMLDDDINPFYRREGTKLVKCDIVEALSNSEAGFIECGYGLGALEYKQYAWSSNRRFVENSFCDVCVWVDNNKIGGLRYRTHLEGKADRDYAMQVIKAGEKTARDTHYAFAAPSNGSNAGGLKEIYYDLEGREKKSVDAMVELWGIDVCQPVVKESGRNDVKINWKNINSNQTSLF